MVEGYLDVISMHQAGVENVVASSGTSLTTEQIRLIGRFTRNMTVIYDGDAAGIKASLRGIDMILKEGMNVRVVSLPEGEDPDTFARKRSSEALQQYIRDHEQDFLDFKAHLLLRESAGDPIRKAALINDMVQSIAQIPDPIQRSVYIKECARTMDVDEQILIGEVARKRLATTGDRETDDFVRRQMAQHRQETPQPEAGPEMEYRSQVEVGSSVDALERELVRDLLKYGHRSFEFKEGQTMVECNVAEVIFGELDADNLHFIDPLYNQILETYRAEWLRLGVGVEVPHDHFVSHENPDVCNLAVDILMADDNYVPSALWRRKDVHVESEEEMLAVGVPKAVTLYKSKVIDRLIKEEQQKLATGDLSEEEEVDVVLRLSQFNAVKVTISTRLNRLIL